MPEQPAVHLRIDAVAQRTGLTNRLKALLKQYFPQALDLCGEELWRPLATALLLKWPTLQSLKKARKESLKQFYYLQGSRSQKLIDQRLECIDQAVPLTDELALLQSYTLRVQLICKELQLLLKTLEQFDQQIAKVFEQHPDREIFAALPGAGPVLAPRLLAGMGSEGTLCGSGQSPSLQRGGAGDQTKRGQTSCPSALSVSEIPSTKFPRIRQGIDPAQSLGSGLLRAAAHQRLRAPHRGAGAGLQMAADPLEMLAESHGIQGSPLRSSVEEKQKPFSRPARSDRIGKIPGQNPCKKILKKIPCWITSEVS